MNTLIISGGQIDLVFLKEHLEQNYYENIIAVDKGLEYLDDLNIYPNHVVGDLDSINPIVLNKFVNIDKISFHKYLPEKDYTDTDIALKLALKLNSSHITIIGALGNRFDHSLANVHIMLYALNSNVPCTIIDKNNKIQLIRSFTTLNKASSFGKYISLIPLTTNVEGITLKGFKYPIDNYCFEIGKSIGVSNEIIDDIATIDIKNGVLILIESKD